MIRIYNPLPLGGEGGPQPALSPVRQPTEPGEGVKTGAPHSNVTPCIQVGADPLTHRLAVPPLPQGGEGRRILCFGVIFMTPGGGAATNDQTVLFIVIP